MHSDRMPRWRTPDAAVADALMRPAGDSRALPMGPRTGGTEQAAEQYREDTTAVLAALGELRRRDGEWPRWLVETYACRCVDREPARPCSSYAELARESAAYRDPHTGEWMRWPGRLARVRAAHRGSRAWLHARLVAVGVVEA